MTAPVYQGQTRTAYTTTASPTGSYPATVLADDLIIASVVASAGRTITWPAGYTEIYQESYSNASAVTYGLAWKRCSGGESGTETFTLTGGTASGQIHMCRVSGAIRSGTPWEAGTSAHGNSTTLTGSAITTTTPYALLVRAYGIKVGADTSDPSSGFTEQVDVAGTGSTHTCIETLVRNAVGTQSSGTRGSTDPIAASDWISYAFAIKGNLQKAWGQAQSDGEATLSMRVSPAAYGQAESDGEVTTSTQVSPAAWGQAQSDGEVTLGSYAAPYAWGQAQSDGEATLSMRVSPYAWGLGGTEGEASTSIASLVFAYGRGSTSGEVTLGRLRPANLPSIFAAVVLGVESTAPQVSILVEHAPTIVAGVAAVGPYKVMVTSPEVLRG